MSIKQIRVKAFERCSGYCEYCGIPLDPNGWALHHRKLKSRGGKDEISNVTALHHYCHNLGTGSVHLDVKEATRRGFIVNSWADPLQVALELDDGSQVLLTAEGWYEPLEGDGNGIQ